MKIDLYESKGLCEIGQNLDVRFAMAHPTEQGFKAHTPLIRCRDFLVDYGTVYLGGVQKLSIYGFTVDTTSIVKTPPIIHLAADTATPTKYIQNVLKMIAPLEAGGKDWIPTKIVATQQNNLSKHNQCVIELDERAAHPLLLSFYTLIIRMAALAPKKAGTIKEFNESIKNMSITINDVIKFQQLTPNEEWYWAIPLLWSKYEDVLKYDPVGNDTREVYPGTIHNGGGINSFISYMGSVVPPATHGLGRRFYEKLNKLYKEQASA